MVYRRWVRVPRVRDVQMALVRVALVSAWVSVLALAWLRRVPGLVWG